MTPATATATSIPVFTATSGRRQPWLALGLSERTYYRRKAAGTLDLPQAPEQHAAHVADWFATLDSLARLDHRAFMRRCLAMARRQDVLSC